MKGFTSDSSTEYSTTYSFEGTSTDTLNAEFATVQVFTSVASDASIKVNWAGAYHQSNDTIYEFDIVSTSSVTSSLDPSTQLKRDSFIAINPITFSGTLYQEDPIQLTITPTNCTFKNVGLNTEIEYNSEYTSTEDNLEALNSKFEQLQVKATASSGVKLNVAIDGSGPDYSFNSVLTESALTCSTNTTIQLQEHEWVDIDPIVFTGTLYTEDPVTVTVTPTNCKIKNFATNPETEHSTTHTFNNVTNLSTLNAEFLNLQVQATAESDTKIVVAVDGSETEFAFGAVPAVSDVSVQSLNINTALTVDQYVDVPIVFTGTIYSDDAVTVTVTPTNCKMKGFVNDAETEYTSQYQFTTSSLTSLNSEFANMQICATDISGVKLAVAIDGASTDYNFANVTAISSISVASFDTGKQLIVDQYVTSPLSFSGKIYSSDPVSVTVTPTNCKFKGLNSNTSTEHSSAYSFEASSLESLNTEFAGLQIYATDVTSVKLNISIDDSGTDYAFNNVIAISDISVTLDTSTQLQQDVYKQINPLVWSGDLYESDSVSVKVTPVNCKFKGVASGASTEYSSVYTFNATDIDSLTTEFSNLQVMALAETGVKLTVQIDTEPAIEFSFANVIAVSNVSASLDTTTQLQQDVYKEIEPIVFSGKVYASDPVTVVVTPTNCKFKGLASGATTEHSSAYTFSSKTTLEQLNTEFASLQVCASSITGVKLTVTIDDVPTEFTFGNIIAVSNVTVASLENTKQINLDTYTAVPITFSGTIYPSDPVTVIVTPTNCGLQGFANDDEEHYSAYTYQATSLEALNTEFAGMEVIGSNNTGIKISVSIDGTSTDYNFTNVVNKTRILGVGSDSNGESIHTNVYTALEPISCIGQFYESDPISIVVTPTNCTFRGCASAPSTEHSSAYTFGPITTKAEFDTEFADIEIKPINYGTTATLTFTCEGFTYNLTFNAIEGSSLSFNDWTGADAQIISTNWTNITGIQATGKLIGTDPLRVNVVPTNCKFRIGSTGDGYTSSHLITNNTNIAVLNTQLEDIELQATAATGINLEFSVIDRPDVPVKSYGDHISLKPSTANVNSLEWTPIGYLGRYTVQDPLVFTPNIDPLEPLTVTITPYNCTIKGFASNADTEHNTAYAIQAESQSALNTEVANLQIRSDHMDAKVTISDDTGASKEFTIDTEGAADVSVSCAGASNALTIGTYGSIGALTFTGFAYTYDPVSVTVTPSNCTFKGVASGADAEHSTAYSFNNQTSVDALNTEFAALQVNCSATDAKLTVTITSAEGENVTNTDITFTNVTAATEPEPEVPEETA